MNTFETGRLISQCRKEKGLTQSNLADMLKISNRTVSKWENGDGFPDITMVPSLCEILGITSDELLAGRKNIVEEPTEPEVLFEAVSPSTVKYYELLFKAHNDRKVPKWVSVVLSINMLIAFAIAFFLIPSITHDSTANITFYFLGIVALLIMVLCISISKIQARAQIHQIKDLNNGVVCDETIRVTSNNKLEIRCGNAENLLDVSTITALIEKKNLYILRLNNRHYAYVAKDCFTIGTANDFASYIRSNMTQKKDKRAIRISSGILAVILTLLTFTVLVPASIFVAVRNEQSTYQDYIEMDTEELQSLDDEKLYDAISAKVDDKHYHSEKELNEFELTFYEVDDFIFEYEDGGFCQYLYNREDGNVEQLYTALDNIGAEELSHKLRKFVDDNKINPNDFNSKNDYQKLEKKYPFNELDKSIENDCKLLKILLTEYAVNNVKNY